jgi:hypothetical protein
MELKKSLRVLDKGKVGPSLAFKTSFAKFASLLYIETKFKPIHINYYGN